MKKILLALMLPIVSALPGEVAHAKFVKADTAEWCRAWKVDASADAAAIKTAIEGDGAITVTLHSKGVAHYKRFGIIVVFTTTNPSAAQEALIKGHVQ